MNTTELQKIADKIRITTFKAIANAGKGHFGGSLSLIEILTSLYFKALNIDPNDPGKEDRDRVILSKGHAGPALYSTLAERGFFPKEWLAELDKSGGKLSKHINRFKVPGVDVSTGALGQGLSVGVRMALAAKIDKRNIKIYVILGDGECNSGQVWETAMAASKYGLDNILAVM